MDKCKIRERILKFFETKKLCTRAYTRAFYKNDPEVYEWLIHYFDDEPSLKNVSLAQKLWHIKHQIDKALPNKFINYQVGYTGVHKKERRFKTFNDCLVELNTKISQCKITSTDVILAIDTCKTIICDAACSHKYQDIVDNETLIKSILYHTPHIESSYYKLLYIIYQNDIFCPICGALKTFKSLMPGRIKSTCDADTCRHIYASNKSKHQDMSHLHTDEVNKKRKLSRAGYTHSEQTKQKISNSNKKVWTTEKRSKLIQMNIINGVYEKQSQTMKTMILQGKFTPKSTNRYTHKTLYSEKTNQTYRSSWELLFHENHINLPLEYETLRIPYTYENVDHVYVVDFVDHIHKQVYEIKPQAYCMIEPNISKIRAGQQWCLKHGYTYNLITEKELCL